MLDGKTLRVDDQARSLAGAALDDALIDAHRHTRSILADLATCRSERANGWAVPVDDTINPPLWEYGHLAWFAEWWTQREPRPGADDREGPWLARAPSLLRDADRWFDSARVAHDTRWHLDLPDHDAIHGYVTCVLEGTRARLAALGSDDEAALEPFRLALFHEDMHGEALVMLRQSLDYPAPSTIDAELGDVETPPATIHCPGGAFVRGMDATRGFAFDNERPPQTVEVGPFTIDRAGVSNRAYRDFVEAGGYRDARLWTENGLRWLGRAGRTQPSRWRANPTHAARWQQRWFGRWTTLPLDQPICHLTAFEAEAYAAWVGRRLPHESEWEWAAVNAPGFRWGRDVWDWTADAFAPYPGFRPDRYREYSAPWFDTHRVVRGGSFATRERMRHPRFRNFYAPERDDLFVGMRTASDA